MNKENLSILLGAIGALLALGVSAGVVLTATILYLVASSLR
jgi:hypothetical protein